AVVNTHVPGVNPRHQWKRSEFMNKGHWAEVELEVIVQVRPDDGVVAIFQADEILAFANLFDHSRRNPDHNPLGVPVQIKYIGAARFHLPAPEGNGGPRLSGGNFLGVE